MLALVEGSKNLRRLWPRIRNGKASPSHLKELVGGAFFVVCRSDHTPHGRRARLRRRRPRCGCLSPERPLRAAGRAAHPLFPRRPTKRSIVYGAEDAQGVVQRTAALNALRTPPAGYLALCTYPEALAERVVDAEALRRETMTVRAGDHLRPADLVEWLDESGFVRVDFVYGAGAVLSARRPSSTSSPTSRSLPYRFDFFDEEGRLDPAVQHFEPAVAGQVAAGPRSFPTSMRAKADGCRSSRRRATCAIGFSMRITPCGAWTICGGGCSPRRTIPPAWTVR